MRKHIILAAAVFGVALASTPAQHVTVLKKWKRSATTFNDIWGWTAPDGREFAYVGEDAGIWIVETTDHANIKEAGWFAAPSCLWRDFTNVGNFVYSVSECHRGIRVIEMVGGVPKDHGYVHQASVTSAHNIRSDPDTGMLYVEGGNNRGLAIFDTSTSKTNPTFKAVWNDNYVHDGCIARGKAYVCNGRDYFFKILDITNVNQITTIGRGDTPGGYNHAAWVSEDDQILCVTDELSRGSASPHMYVFDISDPKNPVKKGDYDVPGHTAHNVFVIGRTAYMSYYLDGFHMIDLADPTQPTKVAHYDTSTYTSLWHGLWGCYPFTDSGAVYGSDMENGLFVFQIDCGHLNRYGQGTAGSAGVPRARFDGATPRVGAVKLRLEIDNLEPNRGFWIGLAAAPGQGNQVLGANLNIDPQSLQVVGPFPADTKGHATIAVPIPNNGALANARIYLQVFGDRGNGTLIASRGMWAGICQ